jgi:hypothetical protein
MLKMEAVQHMPHQSIVVVSAGTVSRQKLRRRYAYCVRAIDRGESHDSFTLVRAGTSWWIYVQA